MADTGAPWNIPYVEPTDIPRTYPTDSEALAVAVAAGLSAAGNAGIGSNVVQTVKTDVSSVSVGVGAVSDAVLSATITPSSDTAKVLVIVQASVATGFGALGLAGYLFRGGVVSDYRGNADGNRVRVASGSSSGGADITQPLIIVFVDSPATDAATTYDLRLGHPNGSTTTLHLNRSTSDTNTNLFPRAASSITLIEVAA